MRILQLIDTLNAGGAERMAVNIANTFSHNNLSNALVITRPPYLLLNHLNSQTKLFTGNKKNRWDIRSFMQILKFVNYYNPDIIHAHSTSILWGCFLKILNPKVKLIWHDHYGNRKSANNNNIHRLLSLLMYGIITVNDSLTEFHRSKMFIRKDRILYIANFPLLNLHSGVKKNPNTLVINANLTPVKDHLTLLKALVIIKNRNIKFTLLIIGKEVDSSYSNELREFTTKMKLFDQVIFKGQSSNIEPFLAEASIGILTSVSEGLPVSLLEYGMAGLAVISTNVGQCAKVLENGEFGWIISPKNVEQLADTIEYLLKNPEQSKIKARKFQHHISERYSAMRFLEKYILFLG